MRHPVLHGRGAQERQVAMAAEFVRRLFSRVGAVDGLEIPREIRRHQLSALNVTLFWECRRRQTQSSVGLGAEVSQPIPNVNATGVQMTGRDALALGWEALRDVMRTMGRQTREQLTQSSTIKDSQCPGYEPTSVGEFRSGS